ncbi:hemin-degrading factor [Marinobacterium marinum]|uniref:Hemin-degrading factor n=1 Tax=Marinobacterium marinum TaxID=2756129 RepID=A0A7W1X056_9GAMM|nr:ChuX/HutX family heme-like substrate-binding protein [Marinobacterium marinum]MBA4503433.1 hemin-degrading factor [Marinobacterium marinum]
MHAAFNIPITTSALHSAYSRLQHEHSHLRRRDLAAALDCSEAELIDAQLDCRRLRLQEDFPQLIEQLHQLGYIMTLTRNEAAVHERKGRFPHAHIHRPIGLVMADDHKIDLRILLNHWHQGFAVAEPIKDGVRYSLQFFDVHGVAIQKIFLQPDSNLQAYFTLLEQFRAEDQDSPLHFKPQAHGAEDTPDTRIDTPALIHDWQNMTDVHQFFGMLKKHGVSRQQALRLAGPTWAQAFAPERLETLLTQAAKQALPLMCFVGNTGNIQIHSGPVKHIKPLGPWLNVLDPEFNLHLQMERISTAWLVRKPSRDGIITSLELYLANGDIAVQFFGVRTEGSPENPDWRRLAESLLQSERACA